jgi:methylmalonyl-CoA/ethylmalonyl-CoA epimerase
MKKKSVRELLSRFHHMGVIVKNVAEAAKFAESIGLGPFYPSRLVHYDRRVHGKPVNDVKIAATVSTLGPIGFEIIAPVSGNSIQKEWLEKHGECINHLCFIVDDINEATSLMLEAGFEAISTGKNEGGGGMAYFVHERLRGVQIELDELPPHLANDFYWGNKPWEK